MLTANFKNLGGRLLSSGARSLGAYCRAAPALFEALVRVLLSCQRLILKI